MAFPNIGPILFLIYINDIVNVCKHTFPLLYADDTNAFNSGEGLPQVTHLINEELQKIEFWLKVNYLSRNIKKIHFILFTSNRKDKQDIAISIKGYPIDEVSYTKILGVISITDRLGKSTSVLILVKCLESLASLSEQDFFFNIDALKTLYKSFIYPLYQYCNHAWGNACMSALNLLVLLQKRMIRIMTGSKQAWFAPTWRCK